MNSTNDLLLVTGASGFVGSHLVERLVELGHSVRCLVRYTSQPRYGWLDRLPPPIRGEIEILAGDLCDLDTVIKAADGVKAILHLAALISVPYSYLHPSQVVETNILGTLNILLAARSLGVDKVVYVSSSEVYGTARYVPIDESHLLQCQSPYAASKVGAEKLVESFFAAYGLPATIIRPFNMYGPRQSARAVVPTIITQALSSPRIALGDTSTTRDFTYVTDTVEALILAAQSDSAVGLTMNIGSSTEVTVTEIVSTVSRVLGKDLHIVEDPARLRPEKSEVRRLRADSSLAQSVLGWRPTVSLEQGLEKTIAWVSANLNEYRVGTYEV